MGFNSGFKGLNLECVHDTEEVLVAKITYVRRTPTRRAVEVIFLSAHVKFTLLIIQPFVSGLHSLLPTLASVFVIHVSCYILLYDERRTKAKKGWNKEMMRRKDKKKRRENSWKETQRKNNNYTGRYKESGEVTENVGEVIKIHETWFRRSVHFGSVANTCKC